MHDLKRSDTELIAAVQSGDDAAFDEIMRRYKAPLLNFVYRHLGNASDAEDVAQEVFVSIYRHMHDFRPDTKFSTWLFGCARNASIDRIRWRKRHPTAVLDEAPPPVTTDTGAAGAVAHEIGASIAAAVAELPEEQRTAIVLSEYHGLPDAAIARVMGCSKKSAELRLYRAKRTLRKRLIHLL